MPETEREFGYSNNEQQQTPKAPRELRREALSAIGSGFKQLFGATAAEAADLTPKLSVIARTVLWLTKAAVVLVALAILVVSGAMLWALFNVPLQKPAAIESGSLLVEAANGQPLGRVGPLTDSVPRKDFPDVLVKAVTSIEDRRFYSHWGVDLRGIARAAYANWTAGAIVEGGSTITQQLAKMQIVGTERSFSRKLREACTAIWLDLRLGKEEVLTRYLNSVYLGAGMHGMAAGARMYFDKNVSELALPEAAMLAGLIQAPSKYNPVRNLDAARRRAATVIDAMLDAGAIKKAAAAKAKAEPAELKLSARTMRAGSWYADWIARNEFPKIAGSVERALRVRTTLQPQLQQLAERIVNEALSKPEEARGAKQAALVAMRPDGSVVAMVGGRNYEDSQFNRAVDAKRQPGSAFKLFVYYAALRKGYKPEDMIDASPVDVKGWEPENYGGRQYGRLTLTDAFAQSVNSAAARLGETVGLSEVVDAARELGLHAPLMKVPSMVLGTNEVTLLDLTGAFASVRAGHPKLEPWGIAAFGQEGSGLRSLGPPMVSAESLPQKDEMTRLLQAVVDRGTGKAARLDNETTYGKTGTSQDYRDAWFIGFNQALVVGIWVGNDDHSPMDGMTGGSLPATIWKRFVSAATPLVDHLPPPAVAVDQTSAVTESRTAASDNKPAPVESPPAPAMNQPVPAQPTENMPAPADNQSAAARIVESSSPPAEGSSSAPTTANQPNQPNQARCDPGACAAKYSSFRASDCTYQPFDGGPRRLCEKGASGSERVSQSSVGDDVTASSSRGCNRDRCARQYRSFDALTCTYQPYDGGPRQVCDLTGY